MQQKYEKCALGTHRGSANLAVPSQNLMYLHVLKLQNPLLSTMFSSSTYVNIFVNNFVNNF